MKITALRNLRVYDYDAIDDIVKPCTVVLTDMYFKEKAKQTPFLKPCTVLLENINSKDLNKISPGNKHQVLPKGLANPKNHCYINCVLQILHRSLKTNLTGNVRMNNNAEGSLMKNLMDSIHSNLCNDLSKFKQLLARYDSFFDGSHQQDAYECFVSILDILHRATKENLVDDDSLMDDDEYIYSLTKRLFMFIVKRSLQCLKCRYLTTSYNQSRVLFVYPNGNDNIVNLLDKGNKSSLTKICSCCKTETEHDETIVIEHSPEIITIVINRFDQLSGGCKNRHKICLNRDMLVTSNGYNLIGSIHHHGNTPTSGHYTSNIFYSDSAYLCNDIHIVPLNYFEPSDSVYMAFYAHSGLLTQ